MWKKKNVALTSSMRQYDLFSLAEHEHRTDEHEHTSHISDNNGIQRKKKIEYINDKIIISRDQIDRILKNFQFIFVPI